PSLNRLRVRKVNFHGCPRTALRIRYGELRLFRCRQMQGEDSPGRSSVERSLFLGARPVARFRSRAAFPPEILHRVLAAGTRYARLDRKPWGHKKRTLGLAGKRYQPEG